MSTSHVPIVKNAIGHDLADFYRCTAADIHQIKQLARTYPHAHNILGQSGAEEYVQELFDSTSDDALGGWYCTKLGDIVCTCVNLRCYGRGNGAHGLWKLRHPMCKDSQGSMQFGLLLRGVESAIANATPAMSFKVLLFLSPMEDGVRLAALRQGYVQEANYTDYYRLGESCSVYCCTHVIERRTTVVSSTSRP